MDLRISTPTFTASLSAASTTCWARMPLLDLAQVTASAIMGTYSGNEVALNSSEEVVVASCGFQDRIASISPVSATIVVIVLSCSSKLDILIYSIEIGNPA